MVDVSRPSLRPLDLGTPGSGFYDHLRDTLHIVVSGLAEATGTLAAGVSVLGQDGTLDTLAVAGTTDPHTLLDLPEVPNELLVRALTDAVDIGGVWLLEGPLGEAPEEPADALLTPLVVNGSLVGNLWVTIRAGTAPHGRIRERITVFGGQVERTLRTALDSHQLGERARLADVARTVVRAASLEHDLDVVLARSEEALLTGLQADRVRIRTHATPGHAAVGAPSEDVPPEVSARLVGIVQELWRDQRAALVTETDVPVGVSAVLHRTFVTLMRAVGIDSVLVVPVGAGTECLGHLVLGRSDPSRVWTDDEARTALEVGHDLGGAVLNARRYQSERRVVQRLQGLDTYRSRLIATVSHEIKNPLAAVRGHLELLQLSGDLAERHADHRDAMELSAQRLGDVVDDLLLLARTAESATPQRQQRVDLAALLAAAHTGSSPEAATRGVILLLGPATAVEVMGDPDDLARVLDGLVTNAVRFSRPGSTTTVTLTVQDDEAVVTCADEGIGMTPDDQARASTEFFRSADPAVQAVAGSGLGLTIADRVVTQHGGRVELESSLGSGTTVRVYLPVASSPSASSDTAAT